MKNKTIKKLKSFSIAVILALLWAGPAFAQGPNCEELRRACENKEQLGEQGAGNCRRYREACEQPVQPNCAELRRACLYKDELGESGAGNCRAYREACTHVR